MIRIVIQACVEIGGAGFWKGFGWGFNGHAFCRFGFSGERAETGTVVSYSNRRVFPPRSRSKTVG